MDLIVELGWFELGKNFKIADTLKTELIGEADVEKLEPTSSKREMSI